MWNGANNDQIWLPMGYMSDSEQCSNQLKLYLISILVNFSCELGQIMTRYDILWTRRVILSNVQTDFTKRLQLDLISLLVNFSCELGQNQIWLPMDQTSDSEQCSNWLQLDLISLLVNFSCELRQIMTRYDFLWARWVILSNVRTDLNLTYSWNFTFDQLFMWIGANNDQIWLSMVYTSNSEQCSNRLQLDLITLLVNFSCQFRQIMTRYDFLWARRVILSNVRTDSNLT